ncbi:hypothetical protein BKA62DRAFT_676464 [Auriculariales sp. MPI-PUGE-AT-0066]|nr:hypothetical protein BKA62DRAFT_676464 [Auriculariales sp. MPI-PUGE-AT-0066]
MRIVLTDVEEPVLIPLVLIECLEGTLHHPEGEGRWAECEIIPVFPTFESMAVAAEDPTVPFVKDPSGAVCAVGMTTEADLHVFADVLAAPALEGVAEELNAIAHLGQPDDGLGVVLPSLVELVAEEGFFLLQCLGMALVFFEGHRALLVLTVERAIGLGGAFRGKRGSTLEVGHSGSGLGRTAEGPGSGGDRGDGVPRSGRKRGPFVSRTSGLGSTNGLSTDPETERGSTSASVKTVTSGSSLGMSVAMGRKRPSLRARWRSARTSPSALVTGEEWLVTLEPWSEATGMMSRGSERRALWADGLERDGVN